MTLVAGARVGPYEVVSPLGAGGMGEVYRARDTKLQREVAIKVLPEHLASDRDRLARFQREAQVLASINHPHIAQIYGFEESGPTHALVLELVEGETLAERLARGPVSLDEALPIAKQIAQALEVAHEQRIVHRDLKPANIKITPAGVVKVLDFGLARLSEPSDTGTASAMAMSPTITSPAMTQAGVILGTAAYMSPEQARGKTVDRRADVWAFGCVFFEMLSGHRVFEAGDTISDVVAAILKNEPDWHLLPAGVPANVRTLLRRCLQKDPQKRLPDIGLVRFELDEMADTATPAPSLRSPAWRRAIPVAVAAILGAALVGSATWATRPSVRDARVIRFSIPVPPTDASTRRLIVSPDGTRVAFVGTDRLYLRSMSESEAKPIPGSEFAQGYLGEPVFSPDGQSLAYWTGTTANGILKRIAIGGGAAVTLYEGSFPMGTTWGESGIVFGQRTPDKPGQVIRLPPGGGAPEAIVTVASGELAASPQILPGGAAVLFTLAPPAADGPQSFVQERWDRAQVVVQRLGSGERTTIVNGGSSATYLPSGHVVYAIGSTVFAAAFDVARLVLTGPAVPVVTGVARTFFGPAALGGLNLSMTDDGTIAYLADSSLSESMRLASIDRQSGQSIALNVPPGVYEHPRASPDGKRLAVGMSGTDRKLNIWIYDLAGTTAIRQLTFEGSNRNPVWSSDGTRVAFQSDREGDLGIFWQRADGASPAERLTKPEKGTAHVPASWSPDGATLLFAEEAIGARVNPPRALRMLRDGKVQPFGGVVTNWLFAIAPVFSPDGRWVAYASTTTPQDGDLRTYVQPFPATGAKYLVGDGVHPLWSRDGTELFVTIPGEMVARRVTTVPGQFGDPSPLTNVRPRLIGPNVERNYDILPDGRFLGVLGETADGKQPSARADLQMHVVVNWFEELRRLAPPK